MNKVCDIQKTFKPSQYRPSILLFTNLVEQLGVAKCPVVRSSDDVASVFQEISLLEREIMIAGAVDSQKRLLNWSLIAVGNNQELVLRLGDVFTGAVRASASGVFLVHNHPSGSLKPSKRDLEVTRRAMKAGKLLGMPVLDHVIISQFGHISIVGLMQNDEENYVEPVATVLTAEEGNAK